MAVSSTFRNHIVVIGLGHLGYRVVKQLYDMDQEIVVIEMNPKIDLVNNIRKLGIPVIEDDGTHEASLEAACIRHVWVVVLCTQNDSMNLQMAVKARALNPTIRVIVRIFDDDFAQALSLQFGFTAFSATGMAAPVFAATAAGIDITTPITIEGEPNSLARLKISHHSGLIGQKIHQVEKVYDLSVVFLRHNDVNDHHPDSDFILASDDVIAVLGSPGRISQLVYDSQ